MLLCEFTGLRDGSPSDEAPREIRACEFVFERSCVWRTVSSQERRAFRGARPSLSRSCGSAEVCRLVFDGGVGLSLHVAGWFSPLRDRPLRADWTAQPVQ